MKGFILAFTIITLILFASSETRSAEKDSHGKAHHPLAALYGGHHAGSGEAELRLSPEVMNILIREMRYLSGAMRELSTALISGDWQQAATIAIKMRDSFIMKQELTSKQMEELHHDLYHRSLPSMIESFTSTPVCSHMPRKRRTPMWQTSTSLSSRRACIKCHSRYAGERFPGFVNETHSH